MAADDKIRYEKAMIAYNKGILAVYQSFVDSTGCVTDTYMCMYFTNLQRVGFLATGK